jgi:hypothetical protein
VTEQNTKKVLAYSTIGSLGLIVGCAGIGTPELAWVGVMIIIFHALAKGLLFLVVGTIENRLYTKDMENFDTLISRLPRVSVLALAGIAGMFIAPFGIVVAKWAAIKAFLLVPGGQGAVMILIMAFGSSLTLFYWGKLLIKVLSMRSISDYERSIEKPDLALRVVDRGRARGRRDRGHCLDRPHLRSGRRPIRAVCLRRRPADLPEHRAGDAGGDAGRRPVPAARGRLGVAPQATTRPTSTPAAAPRTPAT